MYSSNSEDDLVPSGYTDDFKADGGKVYICKQCSKEIKTEQGMKMHIKSKHKEQSMKRVSADISEQYDDDSQKRPRLKDTDNDDDLIDFDFNPLHSDTSSQVMSENLNLTELCNKYEVNDKVGIEEIENNVELIMRERASAKSTSNLLELDESSLPPDQDHNDVVKNDQIQKLNEVIRKLNSDMKRKDDLNNALHQKVSALEDSNISLKSTISELSIMQDKNEARIKS